MAVSAVDDCCDNWRAAVTSHSGQVAEFHLLIDLQDEMRVTQRREGRSFWVDTCSDIYRCGDRSLHIVSVFVSFVDPGRDSLTLLRNEKRVVGAVTGRERQRGMGR